MKVQIDTTSKTIKVQENTNFKKLYEMLKSLPENIFGDWKQYDIETGTQIVWYNNYYPYYTWYGGTTGLVQNATLTTGSSNITTSTTNLSTGSSGNTGIYNFELT